MPEVEARRRTRRSTPVVGTCSRTTSCVPSGEIESGMLGVRTRGQALDGPVLLAACQKMLTTPARADANRTRRLSGVQTGLPIAAGRIGQPRQRLAREIPDPDVVLLIANVERHPRAIGREARMLVGARRCGRQGLLAAVPRRPTRATAWLPAPPVTYTSAPVRETLNSAAPVGVVVTASTTATGWLPTASVNGSKRTACSVPATA